MQKILHFNNLFYTIVLTVIFFSGMDGSLLYQRTFLETETHTLFEHAHFWFSAFGGWFIGYFLIRKIVEKYNPNYIFRVSLLIASLSIWIQYKTHHHSMERLFSQLIINNVFCSILLGLLSYSVVKILNGKNELQYIKSQKKYSILAVSLGLFYSYTLTDNKLGSGFLISTLIYFIAYLYFLKNSIESLDYQIKLQPAVPMILTCFIILGSIAVVYFQLLEKLKFYSEDSYPIFVFLIFLIFESTQHEKNMILISNKIHKKDTTQQDIEQQKDNIQVNKNKIGNIK